MIHLTLKNCNNIDYGQITIKKNTLNIKHGINGTGKSSISKAIEYSINDKNSLKKLQPFKYFNTEIFPGITGLNSISSVKIFNDIYIDKIIYSKNELISNSFDIFIKDDIYIENMNQINNLLLEIKKTFINFPEIETLIENLNKICNSIQFGVNGQIKKTSAFSKAFLDGNKLNQIPIELKQYTTYLKSEKNIAWLKWQSSGNDFLDIEENCPYCASNIGTTDKETILKIKENYVTKDLEHLTNVLNLFNSLNLYFSDSTNTALQTITENISSLKKSQQNILSEIVSQATSLKSELQNIKNLNFTTLKNVPDIITELKRLIIDTNLFSHFQSSKALIDISEINTQINNILTKASHLRGQINKQKQKILKTIDTYKTEINFFLSSAGYTYQVDFIETDSGEHNIKLFSIENNYSIQNVREHLSFGERNAFAIVLFMYEVLKENPDLIILDDPISSFDRNKKYAIIDALFRGTKSLKGKTVLMFTHDFEPILDIGYNLKRNFNPAPTVNFIQNKKNILNEIEIQKTDILSCNSVALENIKNLTENINKLIYLRRYKEIEDDKGNTYALLSSLFHKREFPTKKDNLENPIPMTDQEISDATDEIKIFIHDFDYSKEYSKIVNNDFLITLYKDATNNYEKLQIYRILTDNNNSDNVSNNRILKKFINETFHIENDFLFQLNPCKYELIPEYIITECDKEIFYF